jgi:hypothetical protein
LGQLSCGEPRLIPYADVDRDLRGLPMQFGSQHKSLHPEYPSWRLWPSDVQLAVEVRNKAWMTAALADCLRRHNAVWVLPDQAWMPSPLNVVQRLDAVTGPFASVRLPGIAKPAMR